MRTLTFSLRRCGALLRQSLRLSVRDVSAMVILIFMPLVLIAFMGPSFRAGLAAEGHPDATGAEQAVPGMAVMFAFFLIPQIGYAFFREHSWRTWTRLVLNDVTRAEAFIGKALIPYGVGLLQFVVLFTVGGLIAGLKVSGSLWALALIGASFSACVVALSLLVVAWTRSVTQLSAIGNLAALLLAGLGGALTLTAGLPAWAEQVGRWTPGRWAMDAYRAVILDGGGPGEVAGPCAQLLAASVVLVGLAMLRFSMTDEKNPWG